MNPDLVRAIQHLRVNYGTAEVYHTLMNVLHGDHVFLTKLFSSPQQLSSVNFYNEFMELNAEAERDGFEDQDYAETVHSKSSDVDDFGIDYTYDDVQETADSIVDMEDIDQLLTNTYIGNQINIIDTHDVKPGEIKHVELGPVTRSDVKNLDVNVEKVDVDVKKKGKPTKKFISKKSTE